ncbi:MAG: protein kinase [Myxococcales bacterium]|nr:protein kinase [Myxococcales bacterium]
MRIGQRIAERYQIHSLAGSGGMGKVYCALDERSGNQVAIKVLSLDASKYSRRFLREAKVMAELRHENIVGYVDYGQTDGGAPFIVMEWVKGEDLRQRMNRRRFALQEAVDILASVGGALHFAHQHGIIHRDLKPSNLMLKDDKIEQIKLLDFGIARWRGPTVEKMTCTGISIGTPGYMAPEQSRGDADIDGRADLYALGCVIYECLVGHRPFHGEDVVAVLARTAFDEPPRVSERRDDISMEFDDLLADMMASNVERRPLNGTVLSQRAKKIRSATRSNQGNSGQTGITTSEKELLSIILIDGGGALEDSEHGLLADVLRRAGGHAQLLENGTNVVTFRSEDGAATDLVMRATKCALHLRSVRPEAKMSLATGQGEISGRRSLAKTIQSAATLLRSAEFTTEGAPRALSIRLDQTTSRLLDYRFEVRRRPNDLPGDGMDLFRECNDPKQTIRVSQTVGRSSELATITGVFHECVRERRPRAMLITGEPGIGKSHLCTHALASLQQEFPDVQVWSARAEALAKGSALRLLRELLHQAAGIAADDALSTKRDKLAQTVSRYIEQTEALRTTEFLGELCEVPFDATDARVQLRAARGNAVLMGDQGRLAWEEFLAAVSKRSPVILVLENLHWGDLPTIRLMDGALRRVDTGPWMLIGIASPEVQQVFPSLWQEHGCTVLPLQALDDDACRRLIHGILGHAAKEAHLQRMIQLSGGNAFYLEELTRAYKFSQGDEVPGTVLALTQSRLRTLPALPRQLLRAGSIFSGSFSLAGLRRLLGDEGNVDELRRQLQELAENEFLADCQEQGLGYLGTPQQYSFRNALMREAAYSTLTDTDRELGHRLAALWLHETGCREPLLLAKHFELGKEDKKASKWYALAARQALESNDLSAAISLSEKGISIGAQDRVLGLLHGSIARALLWTGENGRSSEHSTLALENLRAGSSDWARAAGDGVTALGRCGAFADIVLLGTEMVRASRTRGMSGALASAIARSASRLFVAGRYREAKKLFRELPTDVKGLEDSDPVVEGHLLSARANHFLCEGDPGNYLKLSEQSAAAFDACGDRRSAAITRVNVGFAYAELGDYRSAERILRSVLNVAIEMELDAIGSLARNNLGRVLLAEGELDEAWDLELIAIESFVMQGDDRMANSSRVYLSRIHQKKGSLESARNAAKEALQGTSTVATVRMQAHSQLASVLLEMGLPEEALESALAGIKILDALAQVEEGESFVRLMLVEAELQCMHLDEARAALKNAYKGLIHRFEQIDDANWRLSFIEQIEENARIVQLSSELGLVGDDA